MTATELWVPGNQLLDDYPVMQENELVTSWENYLGAPAVGISAVLGAVAAGLEGRQRIASIDLCEVVRETHVDAAGLIGKRRGDIANFGSYAQTLGMTNGEECAVIRVLMNELGTQPIDGIETIADTIRRWRKHDILTVANTSTLPGCEQVTIDFLKTHLEDCFDGIVFPRNHDGAGTTTKASALEALLEETGNAETVERLVHIDDAPYHHSMMIEHMGRLASRSFMGIIPYYAGNENWPAEAHSVISPLAAFMKADCFLNASC